MMDRARAYIPVLGAPGTTTSGYNVSLFPYSLQVSLPTRAEPLRQTCTVDVIRQDHSMRALSLNAALLSPAMLCAALTMSQSGTCNHSRSGWLRHCTLESALGMYRCQRCADATAVEAACARPGFKKLHNKHCNGIPQADEGFKALPHQELESCAYATVTRHRP